MGNSANKPLCHTVLPVGTHGTEKEILLLLIACITESLGRIHAVISPYAFDADVITSCKVLKFSLGGNQLSSCLGGMKSDVYKCGVMIDPKGDEPISDF